MRAEPKHEVVLRPLTIDDCTEQYVAWLNDPEVNRWLETRHTIQDIDTVRAFVRNNTLPDRHLFAIIVESKHIGNIKLGPIHPVHSYADVSYFIGDREEWGKGYATQAVKQVCEFGFRKLGLHRIQAGLYGANEASRKVLRKAGFSVEGCWRRQLKTTNGWDDHWWYARLSEANIL